MSASPAHNPPAVAENFFDRVFKAIAPRQAAKRMQARMTMAIANQFYGSMGSYDGASVTRRETNTWQPFPSDADTASVYDLPALRSRSRDALRNQPLAAGAVNTVVTNVIGPGLNPHPCIDAELLGMSEEEADAWQIHLMREWALFAESTECDWYRTQNFAGLQDLAFRSCLENGDVFALMPRKFRPGSPYALKLQLIEADRIGNPAFGVNVITRMAGIEKDGDGVPVGCHIQKQHPGNAIALNAQIFSWDYYPFFGRTGERQVVHLFRKLRVGQTRGIPYLAPVIEPLKMLGRYKQAELMAAVVSAMFTVFIKTDTGGGLANALPAPGAPNVVTYGSQNSAPVQMQDVKLGNGMVVELGKGESIEVADPKRPNAAFDGFVMSVLRQVGVALELPFEILIKHYTASYSAARAAILDAWRFFTSRREWLADNFCQVVYEAWLTEAVASGRIEAPGFFADPLIRKAYSCCMWVGMPKGHIDESKEIGAAEKRMAMGITTGEEETLAYSGTSWAAKQHQRIKERRLRNEAGLPTPGVTGREMMADTATPQPGTGEEVQGGESDR